MNFVVFAASNWKGLAPGTDVPTFSSLETLFGNIIGAVVSLSGVALFIMLLVGGFKMLLSGGDAKKLESAKGTLTNAIIGLVVIVSAYLILRTIGVITGAPVTTIVVPINK